MQFELPPQGLKIPPKVLYIDIELAMMKVYVYDLYIPAKRIQKEMMDRHTRKFIICWAAAWLDGNHKIKGKIISDVITQREAKQQNDKRICKSIWKLIEQADVIVGHNSDSFDLKVLQWRFLKHELGFTHGYKTNDTFKMAGKFTKPESRGLEYLSLELGGRKKNGLERDEWIEIIETGNPVKLVKADGYCRGDVREGVKVYKHYADAIEAGGGVLYR